MADGFAVGNRGPRRGQRARRAADGAGGATGRTGLGVAEGLGLLPQGGGQGALGQANRGGAGDLLHRIEVHVEAGAALAEGAFGNDFAPALGEVADLLEQLGGELAAWHGLSCLVLAEAVENEVLWPLYDPPLSHAKLLMASAGVGTGRQPCQGGDFRLGYFHHCGMV
jgi:hypothetical protein